jgi:prolyl-tRNA editing enzyme YbaK/EbsC (Cys-tRNA(Pro) deacylase)
MDIPRRPALVVAGAAAAVVLGGVLALTQPWLVLVDEQVSEALPVAAAAPETVGPQDGATDGPSAAPPELGEPAATVEPVQPAGSGAPVAPVAAAEPVELARGELVSHEHATTGTARVLELPDGSRILRLEGLDTSNGPDLHVWLSDGPVLEGRDGWGVFDDGAFLDLGPLEGNQGDANYEIPAGADLADRVVVLDGHARTAAEAAASLGVEVAQIANSLVFLATPHDSPGADSPAAEPFPVLVLASGGHRVDTALVARALGVATLARATPELVRSATGFVIGGVAPVGHLHPLPTLVDADLARHDAVWAAAGHPRTVFPTSHDELVRLTGGASAVVAADPAG